MGNDLSSAVDQMTFNLIGDDAAFLEQRKKLRHSNQKTEFCRMLIDSKMQEPERTRYLEFVSRFEVLDNQRDDVIHRLWGRRDATRFFGRS